MPTGYTAKLHDGIDESFEDFVLHCARGMGAFIMQRDESFDAPPRIVEAVPDAHYVERLEREQQTLAELEHMPYSEKSRRAREAYLQQVKHREEYAASRAAIRERYERRLAEVQSWQVPDVLQSFKNFMVSQLTESIDFDCGGSLYDTPPVEKTPDEWFEAEIEHTRESIARYEQHVAESLERAQERRDYAIAIYTALGVPIEVGLKA